MKTLIALSVLNVVVSGTTLAIVLAGAKQVHDEVEEIKRKTNKAVTGLKRVVEDLDLS